MEETERQRAYAAAIAKGMLLLVRFISLVEEREPKLAEVGEKTGAMVAGLLARLRPDLYGKGAGVSFLEQAYMDLTEMPEGK